MPTDQEDEDARKRQELSDPLSDRFGGAPKTVVPRALPQITNSTGGQSLGSAGQTQPKTAVPQATTNVGNAATARPAHRMSGGNFTNYGDIQAANRDVTQRQVAKYGAEAQAKAEASERSRQALRSRFTDEMVAGKVAAPETATHPDGTYGGPVDPMSGLPLGLDAQSRLTADEMYAKGQGKYTGPMGLGGIEGAEGAAQDALAAQNNLDALGNEEGVSALVQQQNSFGSKGGNKLSGALINSGGQRDFDALRARFNPEAGGMADDAQAQKYAKEAGAESAQNAGKWTQLGDERIASMEAGKRAEAEAARAKRAAVDKQIKEAADEANFQAATKSNAGDEANHAFNEFNKVMSPINWVTEATGTRDPTQDYLMKTFHPNGGAASGSTSGMNIQWRQEDRAVYKQMTPEQWAELNRMTPANQRHWIDLKRHELAGDDMTHSKSMFGWG